MESTGGHHKFDRYNNTLKQYTRKPQTKLESQAG